MLVGLKIETIFVRLFGTGREKNQIRITHTRICKRLRVGRGHGTPAQICIFSTRTPDSLRLAGTSVVCVLCFIIVPKYFKLFASDYLALSTVVQCGQSVLDFSFYLI
jgi:hypothetical protein